MKLGIMQPYFFPYIGYYDLINRSDRWVVFDVVKYIPKSWMNRNRILHPDHGWQYITVPIHKEGEGTIHDVRVADARAAHRRIIGQVEHYRKKRAPFFDAARDLIDRTFADLQSDALVELNVRTLAYVCEYLGIPFEYSVLSSLDLRLPPILHPGAWALEIATALQASEYINPPNGRDLFDPQAFEERGIRLEFTELVDFAYDVRGAEFIEHLSILDVIMWNSPQAIKARLDARKP